MLAAIFLAAISAAKPTVVVVPFATISAQEYASIAQGAALAISAHLYEAKDVNLVSVAELSQLLRRRDLTFDSLKQGALAVDVAKALGADFLITGSYQARWPDLQLTMRVVDGKDGRVRAEVWDLTKLEQALPALDDLSARAFQEMGWQKPKAGALGTSNVYAWREASLAADILALQPYGARPRSLISANALRKARLHCEEAVRLDPKWTYAHACLSFALALAKEPAKALEEAQKAGGHPLAAFASYLAKTELSAIDQAAQKYPGALGLALVASEHHQIRGAHAEAKKVIEKWLERAPDHPLMLARLGKSLVALGDAEKGIAATKKAIEGSGGDSQLEVELASRLIDLKRLDEAETVLNKAMDADKRDGRAYLRLGYVYLLKKKPVEAIAVLERSIAESDLEDEWRARALAHFDLARAHGQVGSVDKAFTELGLAIENGFSDRSKVEGEQDLAALTKDPRWPSLLEKLNE